MQLASEAKQAKPTTTTCPRWNATGMRRVRLLCWHLFRQTPLDQPIDRNAEQRAATRCKLSWEDYLTLKAQHPDLWRSWAVKREKAKLHGWPSQPPQLRKWRKEGAPARVRKLKQEFAKVPGTRGLTKDGKLLVWAFEKLGY